MTAAEVNSPGMAKQAYPASAEFSWPFPPSKPVNSGNGPETAARPLAPQTGRHLARTATPAAACTGDCGDTSTTARPSSSTPGGPAGSGW